MSQPDWTLVQHRRHGHKKQHSPAVKKAIEILTAPSIPVQLPLQCVHYESLQNMIRKRIELSWNQQKADDQCSFPPNTFHDIECNRLLPNEAHCRIIHDKLGIQLCIVNNTSKA